MNAQATKVTISFEGQATETFARFVDTMYGYAAAITTEDGETIEAVLMGSAQKDEDENGDSWYDAILYGRVVSGEDYEGPQWYEDHDGVEYARVTDITIH